MPSPFPGMDPYLEGELWTTVHSQLAAEIARQLAPKIAPRYIARTEKRFVVTSTDDSDEIAIYTDVGVRTARASARAKRSGTLLLEAPLTLQTIVEAKAPHYWVEIRDVKRRKLVTAIEILSPFNKRGEGRVEYLRKRAAILKSPGAFSGDRSAAQGTPLADGQETSPCGILRISPGWKKAIHRYLAYRAKGHFAEYSSTSFAWRCGRCPGSSARP